MSLAGAQVEGRWPQQASPQRHHLGVAGGDVIDVEIEVQLLRLAVVPVWRDGFWRELKTEARCTVDVNRVPIVLRRAIKPHFARGVTGGTTTRMTGTLPLIVRIDGTLRLRSSPGERRGDRCGRWRGGRSHTEALDRSVIAQRHVADAGRFLAGGFQR